MQIHLLCDIPAHQARVSLQHSQQPSLNNSGNSVASIIYSAPAILQLRKQQTSQAVFSAQVGEGKPAKSHALREIGAPLTMLPDIHGQQRFLQPKHAPNKRTSGGLICSSQVSTNSRTSWPQPLKIFQVPTHAGWVARLPQSPHLKGTPLLDTANTIKQEIKSLITSKHQSRYLRR
jgi:hypothetical protein